MHVNGKLKKLKIYIMKHWLVIKKLWWQKLPIFQIHQELKWDLYLFVLVKNAYKGYFKWVTLVYAFANDIVHSVRYLLK